MQARLANGRPGFWPILGAIFAAGWIEGGASTFLWALIACYAVVDLLVGARPARAA